MIGITHPGQIYPYPHVVGPGINFVNPPVALANALWLSGWGYEWLDGISRDWNDVSARYSMDTYGGTTTALLSTAV